MTLLFIVELKRQALSEKVRKKSAPVNSSRRPTRREGRKQQGNEGVSRKINQSLY
jgi:hypothetical protein